MSLWVMAVRELVRAHSEPIFSCRRHHAYVESWFSSLKQARGKDWGDNLKSTCFWSFLTARPGLRKRWLWRFLAWILRHMPPRLLDSLGQKWVEQSMATLALFVLIRLSSRTFSHRSFVQVGFETKAPMSGPTYDHTTFVQYCIFWYPTTYPSTMHTCSG